MAGKKKGIKDFAVGRKDEFRLRPEDLKIDPKWNVRGKTPELKEHIEMLARSIAELGVLQALTIRFIDNEPWVTDGFCRHEATMLAKSRGADIKSVPVKLEERYSNEADHVLSMLTRNSGKPLETIEQAVVVKRLLDFGWSIDEIRQKTGKSITHMNNLQTLLAAPPEIVKQLKAGKVSVRFAMEAMKEHGDKAGSVIEKAIGKAKETGKTKATKRVAREKAPRVRWDKHGPESLSFIERLFKAFDDAESVPDPIADVIVELRAFLEDAGIKFEKAHE